MTCTLAGALRRNFKSSACSEGRSADQSQSVARALYLRASAKSFFGDGFLNAALIFRGLGTDGIVGSPWRGFFRRSIRGFHFGHGVPSARGSLVRALRGVGARARLRIPSGSPRRRFGGTGRRGFLHLGVV